MSVIDYVLVGTLIALFSAITGTVIGKHGKVSKEDCENKRGSCSTIICNELKHIKDEQKEMRADIKELLSRTQVIEKVVN